MLEKHSTVGTDRHLASQYLANKHCTALLPGTVPTYLDCSVRATRCSLLAHIHGLDQCASSFSLPWLGRETRKRRRTVLNEPPVHSQLALLSTHLPFSIWLAHSYIAHTPAHHTHIVPVYFPFSSHSPFLHSSLSFAPNTPFISRAPVHCADCRSRELSLFTACLRDPQVRRRVESRPPPAVVYLRLGDLHKSHGGDNNKRPSPFMTTITTTTTLV